MVVSSFWDVIFWTVLISLPAHQSSEANIVLPRYGRRVSVGTWIKRISWVMSVGWICYVYVSAWVPRLTWPSRPIKRWRLTSIRPIWYITRESVPCLSRWETRIWIGSSRRNIIGVWVQRCWTSVWILMPVTTRTRRRMLWCRSLYRGRWGCLRCR